MSPGAVIAVGFWVLLAVASLGGFIWLCCTSPTWGEDQRPLDDDRTAGLLCVMDDDPTPHGRRHV